MQEKREEERRKTLLKETHLIPEQAKYIGKKLFVSLQIKTLRGARLGEKVSET